MENGCCYLLMSVLLGFLAGCTGISCCMTFDNSDENSISHIIIGVGIVTTPKNIAVSRITAIDVKAVGAVVSDQPGINFGLGYSSASAVMIADDTQDAVVEVSSGRDGETVLSAKTGTDL